jgi:hypothetical protein
MPHCHQQDGVGGAQQVQSIRGHHAPVAEIMVKKLIREGAAKA